MLHRKVEIEKLDYRKKCWRERLANMSLGYGVFHSSIVPILAVCRSRLLEEFEYGP